MNVACTVATEMQNKLRAELQADAQAALFADVDCWVAENSDKLLPPVEWTYWIMGIFTRRYIQVIYCF